MTRDSRPVWFLDIDGVINAFGDGEQRRLAYPDSLWRAGRARTGFANHRINWSVRVVVFIRAVHESGKVEIVWHTTWVDDANKVADLVGLPHLPHTPRLPEQLDWWKVPAVRQAMLDGREVIWTDDEIGIQLSQAQLGRWRQFAPGRTLIIAPDGEGGLTLPELIRIAIFAGVPQPALLTPAPVSTSEEDK